MGENNVHALVPFDQMMGVGLVVLTTAVVVLGENGYRTQGLVPKDEG